MPMRIGTLLWLNVVLDGAWGVAFHVVPRACGGLRAVGWLRPYAASPPAYVSVSASLAATAPGLATGRWSQGALAVAQLHRVRKGGARSKVQAG